MLSNQAFENAITQSRVVDDILLGIAAPRQFHGWFESQAMLSKPGVPDQDTRNNSGAGPLRDRHQSCRGAGRHTKERDKDPGIPSCVLVNQDSHGAALLQGGEDFFESTLLFDDLIATERAVTIDQCIDERVVDGPDDELQRMAVKRVGERTELPGPEVSGEEERSSPALLGSREVFEAIIDDNPRDVLGTKLRHLAELSQQPAQVRKHSAYNLRPLGRGQLGPSHFKVPLGDPSESFQAMKKGRGGRSSCQERSASGKHTQSLDQGKGCQILQSQPDSNNGAVSVSVNGSDSTRQWLNSATEKRARDAAAQTPGLLETCGIQSGRENSTSLLALSNPGRLRAFAAASLTKPTPYATGRCLRNLAAAHFIPYMDNQDSVIELRIQSSLEYTELVENITNNLTVMAGCDSDQAYFIEMAVREIVVNAIRHGNQMDLDKVVRVLYRFNSERFEVGILDQGNGFDFEHLPDPCDPENLMKSSGRGIFLVRSFMDDFSLAYIPNQGTEVRFTKKLSRSR